MFMNYSGYIDKECYSLHTLADRSTELKILAFSDLFIPLTYS
jgi:hypothetical protein